MKPDTIALFTSHFSKCDSLLTLEDDIYVKNEKDEKTKEITINAERPVSIFAIAAIYKLPQIFVVDNILAGFWQAYKNSQEFNIPVFFGLKMTICADMNLQDEKDTSSSRNTESNVIIFLKNSAAYSDACRIYTQAATKGFYYRPRLDWKTLNSMWTENLMLCVPFYSSFLARNMLFVGRSIIPDIDKLNPSFLLEKHDLPMDDYLRVAVESYTASNNFVTQKSHSIYYYQTEDHIAYQTLKCIDKTPRTTIMKPNLDGHGSRLFSFESFQNL